MPKTIRVLIVEDHPLVREGVRELLSRQHDFQVVGEAGDGEEAVRLAEKLVPDVVLMDVGIPKVNGLEATRLIKKAHSHVTVLVLTIHDEDEYILGLLQAGAAGYLLKNAYGEELVNAIRAVRSGEFVLHPLVARRLLSRREILDIEPQNGDNVERLSPRETEVLQLAAGGMTNHQIATKLGITVRTVKGHLINAFGKLRVGSRTEAVVVALRHKWIQF